MAMNAVDSTGKQRSGSGETAGSLELDGFRSVVGRSDRASESEPMAELRRDSNWNWDRRVSMNLERNCYSAKGKKTEEAEKGTLVGPRP